MYEELMAILANVGKSAIYHLHGCDIMTKIVDVKLGFGKVYYEILFGNGEKKWVLSDNLDIMSTAKAAFKSAWRAMTEVLRQAGV